MKWAFKKFYSVTFPWGPDACSTSLNFAKLWQRNLHLLLSCRIGSPGVWHIFALQMCWSIRTLPASVASVCIRFHSCFQSVYLAGNCGIFVWWLHVILVSACFDSMVRVHFRANQLNSEKIQLSQNTQSIHLEGTLEYHFHVWNSIQVGLRRERDVSRRVVRLKEISSSIMQWDAK